MIPYEVTCSIFSKFCFSPLGNEFDQENDDMKLISKSGFSLECFLFGAWWSLCHEGLSQWVLFWYQIAFPATSLDRCVSSVKQTDLAFPVSYVNLIFQSFFGNRLNQVLQPIMNKCCLETVTSPFVCQHHCKPGLYSAFIVQAEDCCSDLKVILVESRRWPINV